MIKNANHAITLGFCLIMTWMMVNHAHALMTRPPVSSTEPVLDLAEVAFRVMPGVDNAALTVAARAFESGRIAVPYEFAHPFEVAFDTHNSGTWETLTDGSRLWRLRVISKTAISINLGFDRFQLPEGAGLWVHDGLNDHIAGPYTQNHQSALGRLFTQAIRGDEIVIEVYIPDDAVGTTDVSLGYVNHAFRSMTGRFQGACNNDVICPVGDPWRDQISSVAMISIGGFILCSGQMVNNTRWDKTPYLLTADHCGLNSTNADSLVVYWNFESPVCGLLDGGSLDDNQSGATFIASHFASDTALVRLDQQPLPDFKVFYGGWDVSGATPMSSVSIHHPSAGEKAISFDDDPSMSSDIGRGGQTHWKIGNWESGTTEGGSSGSYLFDADSGLCVGVLTGATLSGLITTAN